jgi:ribosomal protein S11
MNQETDVSLLFVPYNGGIEVTEIIDVTPMPHNGCRPPRDVEFNIKKI